MHLAYVNRSAAQIIDPDINLNPLNNFFFTASSSLVIIGLGWWLTDKVVEPRLQDHALRLGDGAAADFFAFERCEHAAEGDYVVDDVCHGFLAVIE